jgi:hypothetical protein
MPLKSLDTVIDRHSLEVYIVYLAVIAVISCHNDSTALR